MNPQLSLEIKQVAVCLLVVAVALIAVGIVSDSLGRHIIQIVPPLLAFLIIPRWTFAGVWAAVGIFGMWFAAMVAIWAYLLGLADIVSGTYSNVEVFLTIVIAGCSAHAIQKAVQGARRGPLLVGVVALAGGLAAQVAAIVLSYALFA